VTGLPLGRAHVLEQTGVGRAGPPGRARGPRRRRGLVGAGRRRPRRAGCPALLRSPGRCAVARRGVLGDRGRERVGIAATRDRDPAPSPRPSSGGGPAGRGRPVVV